MVFLLVLTQQTLAHEDVEHRIEHLADSIAQTPQDALLHVKRGRLYLESSRYLEAASDFEYAIARSPGSADAYYYLADTQRALGRYEAALQSVQQFRIRASHRAAQSHGWLLQGDILYATGRFAEAAHAYEHAIEFSERRAPRHYLKMADAQMAREPQAIDSAVRWLEKGLDELGPVPSLQDRLVAIEAGTGRLASAIQRLDAMLAQGKRLAQLHFRRAQLLGQQGEEQKARQALQQALESIGRLPAQRQRVRAIVDLREQIEQQMGD
jgi:tetratricopeptide (TPR) repeat protein